MKKDHTMIEKHCLKNVVIFIETISITPLRNSNVVSFFLFSKSTNIENKVQIRPILYSSQSIRLQMFFCVSDKYNLLSIVYKNDWLPLIFSIQVTIRITATETTAIIIIIIIIIIVTIIIVQIGISTDNVSWSFHFRFKFK